MRKGQYARVEFLGIVFWAAIVISTIVTLNFLGIIKGDIGASINWFFAISIFAGLSALLLRYKLYLTRSR